MTSYILVEVSRFFRWIWYPGKMEAQRSHITMCYEQNIYL
jgi:hypothetical protein